MTKQDFDKQVANHAMTIHVDSGKNRHLTFKPKGNTNMWFEIVTWYGSLCINGDMGTYVFSRVPDMFNFFRDREINPSYWAEKCIAQDLHAPVYEFSANKFSAAINKMTQEFIDAHHLTEEQIQDLRDEILEEVAFDGNEHQSFASAAEFSTKHPTEELEKAYPFVDLHDHDFTDFSYLYLWNCHAILWAINKYDEFKALQKPITLTVGTRTFDCANLTEASQKYQWLKDLTRASEEEFPLGFLSDGAYIRYNGEVWNGNTLIIDAANKQY